MDGENDALSDDDDVDVDVDVSFQSATTDLNIECSLSSCRAAKRASACSSSVPPDPKIAFKISTIGA